MNDDFDFNGGNVEPVSDADVAKKDDDVVTDLTKTDNDTSDANDNDDDKSNDKGNPPVKDNDDDYNLSVGDVIEVDNNKYTVDANGNLLDKDNKVFKEAKDVKDWLKGYGELEEKTENDTKTNLDIVKEALGINLVDDKDQPIEFENTEDGIKSYIQTAFETVRDEHYNEALASLYQRYPIIEDVLNYYVANGNSLDGFNQQRDLSNVVVDDNDTAQQEAIIKLAWEEQDRKGDVNSYIEYLKASGNLAYTAKEELQGLIESDNAAKEQLREEAEAAEREQYEATIAYWQGVKDVIDTRKIGEYQIPETIVVNRDGKTMAATPNDFFNYLYLVDNEGVSAYQRDLMNESPESRVNDELIRAYLKFVGGSYTNLVDMAVAKKEAKILRTKAATKRNNSIKVTRTAQTKSKDIDFGL